MDGVPGTKNGAPPVVETRPTRKDGYGGLGEVIGRRSVELREDRLGHILSDMYHKWWLCVTGTCVLNSKCGVI